MDDTLQRAVAEGLEADIGKELAKDTPRPAPTTPLRLRPITPAARLDPANSEVITEADMHSKWLSMGEKLHDQQVEKVNQLAKQFEDDHAAFVAKGRALEALRREYFEEKTKLDSYRLRLGYAV